MSCIRGLVLIATPGACVATEGPRHLNGYYETQDTRDTLLGMKYPTPATPASGNSGKLTRRNWAECGLTAGIIPIRREVTWTGAGQRDDGLAGHASPIGLRRG